MSIDLSESFKPGIKAILADPSNWSKKYMPEACAACHKPFDEDDPDPPFHLWAKDGRWAISFHLACAFKTYIPPMGEDEP